MCIVVGLGFGLVVGFVLGLVTDTDRLRQTQTDTDSGDGDRDGDGQADGREELRSGSTTRRRTLISRPCMLRTLQRRRS